MRRLVAVLFLVFGCWLPTANAQYLEATVTLPDSFGSVAPLGSIVYNPASDRIYVGDDSGSILVVDARTSARLARIRASSNQRVGFLLPIPGTNKLYSSGSYVGSVRDTSVKVIDCGSNSVVTEVPVRGGCALFAGFDSAGGKAYYLGYDTTYVLTAIDVTGDSAVASITLGQEAIMEACFNIRSRKLYFTGSFRHSRRFTVVDTRGDSVLLTMTLTRDPTVLGYNPTENKVYCGRSGGVYIFDGETDSLIGERAFGSPCVIGCNPDANKVYCGIGGGGTAVYILDGRTDSTIAVVDVGHGPRAMLYNPADSNMYVACGEGFELSVIDGQGDSVVAHLTAGQMASWLTLDAGRNLVYCAPRDGYCWSVSVTHGTTVTPAGVIYIGLRPDAVCSDPVGDKVYVANWDPLGCVAVIDCSTNEVAANIRVGQYPQSLCYNAQGNKVYCANSEWSSVGKISVIDAGADTVLSTIQTAQSAHDVCYNPARNRVYCGHSVEHVTVIDAGPDTIVKLIPTPSDVTELTYVAAYNKLYFSMPVTGDYYLGVIDCATESLTTVLHCMGEAFLGHRANGKVYFISHEVLKAMDGNGDTLVPPVLDLPGIGNALCWNSVNDKLYWAGGDSVAIVDCASDTVITAVRASAARLFYDSSSNRIYCSGPGVVTVIDGATDQVLLTIPAGEYLRGFAYSARQSRLYVPDVGGSSVFVIRTVVPGVVEQSLGQRGPDLAPTASVVRGVLFLAANGEGRKANGELLDVSGRKVLALHPGANDVRRLSPGVYFVRGEGRGARDAGRVRKVVVTR